MKRIMLCMCVFVVTYSLSAVGQTGIIQGSAVDENADPVSEAEVTWFDLDASENVVEAHTGPQASVNTDKTGHFTIEHLVVDHNYALVAKKESAGYPDMSMSLHNPLGKTQTTTARPKGQVLEFRLQMGPKAARLKWDVRDAITGAHVKGLTFAMHRGDGAGESAGLAPLSGSAPASYSLLVPTDVGVSVEFSAKGYKTWYYPGTTTKAATTFMSTAPGQTTKLDVRLEQAGAQHN